MLTPENSHNEWTGRGGQVTGAVVFAITPSPGETRLLASGGAALIATAFSRLYYRRCVTGRLRKYYREQLGGERTFEVEVELLREGIRARQKGTQITFEWPSVDAIQETADSVDIGGLHGGLIVVRKRAFESPEAIRLFINQAHAYLGEARGSTNTAHS